MVQIGYTLMCEQAGPRQLVADAVAAEKAGFDFEVISDHFSPWLASQGHASAAWPVLGSVAILTERVELMTYVTCPTIRYHPAVIAQQAATVALLADGRFTLGLGSGENLNEHVVGQGWPPANVRQDMFGEALDIIRALHAGGFVSYQGKHFQVDSAKVWDLPADPIPLGIAVSGAQSCAIAGAKGDAMIAVEPEAALGEQFDAAGGKGKPRIGQVPICWGPDKDEAIAIAHDQFRWFGGGWKVNAELPSTAGFAAASQFVRPEDVAEALSCGPDLDAHVASVQAFVDAGFTHVAVIQIGAQSQPDYIRWAESDLLPALRTL